MHCFNPYKCAFPSLFSIVFIWLSVCLFWRWDAPVRTTKDELSVSAWQRRLFTFFVVFVFSKVKNQHKRNKESVRKWICAGAGAFLKRQDKRWFIWLYNGQAHALDLYSTCMHFDWSIWFVRAVAHNVPRRLNSDQCVLSEFRWQFTVVESKMKFAKLSLHSNYSVEGTLSFSFSISAHKDVLYPWLTQFRYTFPHYETGNEHWIRCRYTMGVCVVCVNWLTLEICLRKQSENRMKASKNVSSLTSFHTQPMNLFRTRKEPVKK